MAPSPTLQTTRAAVDVLFVTNQGVIPQAVTRFLAERGYAWDRLGTDTFVEGVAAFEAVGTVVVDTTEMALETAGPILQMLKRLEQDHVAAILLNDAVGFPFSQYKLATLLQSASLEEIAGRIETNIAYRNSLRGQRSATRSGPTGLGTDTLEQLKMAGEVQRSFLPHRLPDSDRLRWAVLFRPAEWVSGDIYDVQRLDEQHIGFYIADAVGHSMPAALLTMFLKHAIILRETRDNDYRLFPPVEVLRQANDRMAAQELAGCLFATCCYGLLNFRTLQLTFARAGHPYPILIRPGQEPQQLECRGGLLGVFPQADFQQRSVQLASGDKVLLTSDGCEPLVGSCDAEGRFRFTEAFCSLTDLGIEEFMERFDHMAETHTGPAHERDDMSAVGLEVL
ncbi:MAG TPA: hypothetical protein ENN87_08645 [Phycisphaerales bacterium]|nr:hypothetical protein [Phycisphaerales bacterium]